MLSQSVVTQLLKLSSIDTSAEGLLRKNLEGAASAAIPASWLILRISLYDATAEQVLARKARVCCALKTALLMILLAVVKMRAS